MCYSNETNGLYIIIQSSLLIVKKLSSAKYEELFIMNKPYSPKLTTYIGFVLS